MDLYNEELDPATEERMLDELEAKIRKHGMETPVMMMLEMHKPLAGVLSQASIVFAPYIIPFFGFDNLNNYGRLLGKTSNIDNLVNRLSVNHEMAANKEAS